MAEVTQITNQFKYDFDFTNASGSTATRSFTIDTRNFEGGISSAQELQRFFAGQGSLSVAAIVPNQFVQPTGWRDNDPNEPPWTTQTVYLTAITKYETTYDPAGGGGGDVEPTERNYSIVGADDEQSSEIHFSYDGISDTVKPTVNVFYNNKWNPMTVNYQSNGSYYLLEKTELLANKKGTIFIPATNDYAAELHEFTIVY